MSTFYLNRIDEETNLKLIHLPRRLITFCENMEYAVFLSQIIYWHDKGNNNQKWFFKSAKEWQEEINVKQKTIQRATRLFEKAGFLKTLVAKEYGKRVTHYKLNFNLLLKMLKGVDNLTSYVRTICPLLSNSNYLNRENDFNTPGYKPPRGFIPITDEDGETRLYPFREQLRR